MSPEVDTREKRPLSGSNGIKHSFKYGSIAPQVGQSVSMWLSESSQLRGLTVHVFNCAVTYEEISHSGENSRMYLKRRHGNGSIFPLV